MEKITTENLIKIGNFEYDMSSPSSSDFKKRTILSFGDDPIPNIKVNWFHIDGFELHLSSNTGHKYDIEIYDGKNRLLYTTKLSNGMFTKLNRKYFDGIRYKVSFNGYIIKDETINFKGKKVGISFESSSLGDTLAWIPYCEEFAKQHQCEVVVSTFMNDIFEGQYPNVSFVQPGSVMQNISGFFKLGWFYNHNMEPTLPNTISLQKAATSILGLDFKEIRPKFNFTPTERPIENKYVTIGMSTTAGCKEWSYEGGWQILIDTLNNLGYKVAIIQKEGVDPNIKNVLDWTGNYPLQVRMNQLYHSDFYIGLGSGLSWLAWSMNTHVVMISNFSLDGHEFTDNVTRITNTSVCNGCWNNPNYKFDKGDWYWCPIHKGTDKQFECHKSITPEMVITSISHLL